jgi:hypothetical protein
MPGIYQVGDEFSRDHVDAKKPEKPTGSSARGHITQSAHSFKKSRLCSARDHRNGLAYTHFWQRAIEL